MKAHRPFNSVIGILIVAFVLLGFGYSFLENHSIEYYTDHPDRILFIVGLAFFSVISIRVATRRFPRLLPVLHILSLVILAGSLLAAYATTAHFWGNSETSVGYRWLGAAFTLVLGALTMATWRELKTAWRGYKKPCEKDKRAKVS